MASFKPSIPLNTDSAHCPSGWVHIIMGPMFAGKTTAHVRRIKSEGASGRNMVMKNSNKDNKYTVDLVVPCEGPKNSTSLRLATPSRLGTKQDLPAAMTTTRLVGETTDPVLQVNERGINNGLVRVRLTLHLHDLVRLERRIRVSSKDVITVKFRYERLLERCRDCAMINHRGLPCPSLQEPPSPVVFPAIQLVALPMMVF
ncbi:hypothetical protein ACLB2K_058916 [Fragaria x ananassa]